ncbi:MAG: Uma2 family endonuclease [Burkholderiaceae bacterium]
MGNLTSHEALALRWAELIHDPTLSDLPYKIELNNFGKLEMSPASNRHGRLQARIAAGLIRQLTDGDVLTECSIFTELGVSVPAVAWASNDFLNRHGEETPYPEAPEICVEIRQRAASAYNVTLNLPPRIKR